MRTAMSDTERIQVCAVVVSYKPSRDLVHNARSALSQLAHVIIVDNTPTEEMPEALTYLEREPSCTILRQGANLGIASALNIGIRHALAVGFLWVITLDQDSWMRDGYVEEMLSTYRRTAASKRVGMVCPRYQDELLGIPDVAPRSKNGDVFVCITSGALIPAETFRVLGPLEDDFFIDSVDHEYCLRLRAAGLQILECPTAILVHSLGRIGKYKLLRRHYYTTNHNARRRYYITRNRLVLMKRYFFRDREWTAFDGKRMLRETALIFMLEEDRLSKAKFMILGFWDAIFNRLGQRVAL